MFNFTNVILLTFYTAVLVINPWVTLYKKYALFGYHLDVGQDATCGGVGGVNIAPEPDLSV